MDFYLLIKCYHIELKKFSNFPPVPNTCWLSIYAGLSVQGIFIQGTEPLLPCIENVLIISESKIVLSEVCSRNELILYLIRLIILHFSILAFKNTTWIFLIYKVLCVHFLQTFFGDTQVSKKYGWSIPVTFCQNSLRKAGVMIINTIFLLTITHSTTRITRTQTHQTII